MPRSAGLGKRFFGLRG